MTGARAPHAFCFAEGVFHRITLAVVLCAMASCQGSAGALAADRTNALPALSSELNPCTNEVAVGSAPIRRLSHAEYAYSLIDVLDSSLTSAVQAQAATLLADSVSLGFKNSAAFLQVSNVLATNYMDAAEQVSIAAVKDLPALLPCAAAAPAAEAPCAGQFITGLGAKLYRRPLSAEETAAYTVVYESARKSGYDFATGIQWVLFTFLQSPGFLYRVEVDGASNPAPVRALDAQELAVRLSYLIWQSGPDAALAKAAADGKLKTKDDLAREATRMLTDAKAARTFDFFSQWLNTDSLASLERDATAFPNLDPGLPRLFQTEVQQFVSNVVMKGDSKLSTLLTAPYTYANAALAKHYGLPAVTGTGWQQVPWQGRRGGLFMLGGVLTAKDKTTRTSIVRRGLMMRTQLMCQLVPAPPPDIPSLGPIDQTLSQADRLAGHRSNPSCAGCHTLLDPLGVPFENIDAVGRPRTADEGGHPSLTAGVLTGLTESPLEGPVIDGLDLMSRFGQSSDVASCFTTQLYRFSAGRKEEPADACSRYQLRQRFAGSGGNIKDLIVGLTQTDDFSNRRVTLP